MDVFLMLLLNIIVIFLGGSISLNNVVPVVALRDFCGLVLFAVGSGVVEFQILDAYASVRVNGTRDECVATDDCIFAHDGIAAENGGSSVNSNVVLNRRVALFAGKSLAASCRECA